jgi:DNA repair protein RecN (Recombination protein N)
MLDEIDSGVSGQIGNQIRDILRALGQKRQVLCISHLAQVASGAHCHFGVYKKLSQKAAETCVDMLLDEKRVEALSKLMCGQVDVEMLGQARRLLELEH